MCKSSLQRADSGNNHGSSPVLEVGSLHSVCLAVLPQTNNCCISLFTLSIWNYLLWWMSGTDTKLIGHRTIRNYICCVVKDMHYLRPRTLNWTLEVSVIYMWKKRIKWKFGYWKQQAMVEMLMFINIHVPLSWTHRRTTFPSLIRCGQVIEF